MVLLSYQSDGGLYPNDPIIQAAEIDDDYLIVRTPPLSVQSRGGTFQNLTPGSPGVTQTDNSLSYNDPTCCIANLLMIDRPSGLTYTAFFYTDRGSRYAYLSKGVFGSATSTKDIPVAQVLSYSLVAHTSFLTSVIVSFDAGQSLTINTATGQVQGVVSYVPYDGAPKDTLTLRGALDPGSGIFSGSFTSATKVTVGQFRGRLFGPAASEIGFVFELNSGKQVSSYFSTAVGKR